MEEISLFDIFEDEKLGPMIEDEKVARDPKNNLVGSKADEEPIYSDFMLCQNKLWQIYKTMINAYQFPSYTVIVTTKCNDWKDKELRKHGEFKKNILKYKQDFRNLTTVEQLQEKLGELKAVMDSGNFHYHTEHLEKALKKLK